MNIQLNDAEGNPNTAEHAVEAFKAALHASGLPMVVFGPGQPDADNEILVEISDGCQGERLALGVCEEKNYRTIVASALANDHLVIARTAMDVNLAKQLNILINDMGMPMDRIMMDPTTGALGYGFEYGYSVMERLRIAALQGDKMTQLPMLVPRGRMLESEGISGRGGRSRRLGRLEDPGYQLGNPDLGDADRVRSQHRGPTPSGKRAAHLVAIQDLMQE